jgi:NAD+ kinase
MSRPFQSIALVGRHGDARVAESLLSLAAHLSGRGLAVLVEHGMTLDFGAGGEAPSLVTRIAAGDIAKRAQLVIAIGGDGTMLYAARLVAERPVPLLGINRGRLGFLTDVSPADMLQRLDEVLAGHYSEDRRTLIEARLDSSAREQSVLPALNDVVVQKWETGRMLDFETWIDGRYVNTHSGDGLVIATATGSTAYALSCGGPIVHPELDVLVLAPICPHTLSDRPVIVPGGSRIEIRLVRRSDSRAQVVCDGVQLGELGFGERLTLCPSAHKITLLHPPGHEYYRLLRSKLHWGRGSYDRTGGEQPEPAER